MSRACLLLLLHAALLALAAVGDAAAPVASHGLRVKQEGREPCHSRSMRKSTLKLIKETPFAGVFRDLRNSTKFEASGLARVRGELYVVFDNAMSIGHLDDRFGFRDPHNVLVGEWEPESQFEGIAHVPENETFLLLHEALPHKHSGQPGGFKPYIREVRMRKDLSGYDTLSNCEVDFEFDEENKGFESINYIHTKDGPVVLGLCEGNYCKGGAEGREKGNGRIVAATLQWHEDGSCAWVPEKDISVPEGAFFQDYSAMAYNYETRKLAVLSQEEAAVWVGDFDGDALEFDSQEGQVFHLPRDNHCEMIYCNAEGIQWIDHYRVVVGSDKAKAKQPYWCDAKDQAIHLFAMPQAWDPWASAAEGAARLAREIAAEEEEERRAAAGEL